jgi:hypothetical protein
MDPKIPKLNRKTLTAEQLAQLEAYEATQQQLTTLSDIADMVQEITTQLDDKQTDEKMGALLVDIRESLKSLNDKEAPEPPDYAKPVVDSLGKLEKALTGALRAIDVKPNVNVAAPNVTTPPIDTSKIESAVKDIPKAFEKAIKLINIPKVPKTDFKPLLTAWEGISEQLVSIENATRMKPQMGSIKVSNLGEVNLGASAAQTTSVGDSTASNILIDANPARKEVEFYNNSSALLYLLKGGGVASSSNYTVTLAGLSSGIGGYYRTSHIGAFSGVWATDAGGTVQITESV